jgi:two-component system, response regulator / RNA-binding antiterminator
MSARPLRPTANNSSVNKDAELCILLIDENEQRSESISCALNNSRYRISHLASLGVSLLKQVDEIQPDIIVMDMESPSRDILESLQASSHFNPKPVVMFATQKDTHTINQSIESGVSACVVGDIDPDRLKPILNAAVARFREFQKLKSELIDTKQQLASRKIIDQAICLLMEKKNLSEDDAFRAMRKTKMDTGQKLDDVAKTLISLLSIL